MILLDDFIMFFKNNNISYCDHRSFSKEEYNSLINNAENISKSFSKFLCYAAFDSTKENFQLNFESFDDAYNGYCMFVSGIQKAKLGKFNYN